MFLRNAWYVAAWDREVTAARPLGRTLLDEPVVGDAGQILAIRLLRRRIAEEREAVGRRAA